MTALYSSRRQQPQPKKNGRQDERLPDDEGEMDESGKDRRRETSRMQFARVAGEEPVLGILGMSASVDMDRTEYIRKFIIK